MTKLLEMKDKLIKFYSMYEVYAKPVIKFVGYMIMYIMISSNIGYNAKVSSIAVTLVLSLIGCLLPVGFTVFFASIVILLDMYSLSAEVAMIGAVIFLLILVLYFRFSSKYGALALLTPVLLKLNMANIIPISTGLVGKPFAIIPAICGTVVYFFISGVHLSASSLTSETVLEGEETVKYTLSINQLVGNKEMYLYIGLFIVTCVLVYVIRRTRMDHAWTIATVAGVVLQLVGFFVGFLVLKIEGRVLGLILGNIVALLLGMVLQFLLMNLDYARTERVQFEDDDYYYYVKAVPKKMVASKSVTVKKFGTTSSVAKRVPRQTEVEDLDISEEQDKITRQIIAKELDINEDWLK